MAARSKKKPDRRGQYVERRSFFEDLSPHTKQAIGAVIMLTVGIFFILALLGFGGLVGNYTTAALRALFGGGAMLAPVVCFFYVYAFLRPTDNESVSTSKVIGIALLFVSVLGLLGLYQTDLGGFTGLALTVPMTYLIGEMSSAVVLSALMLIAVFLTLNVGFRLPRREATETDEEVSPDVANLALPEEGDEAEPLAADEATGAAVEAAPKTKTVSERLGLGKGDFVVTNFQGHYDPPPLSLLNKDKGKSKVGDIKASANIIKRTLKNFGIDVEMDEVSIGPSVTRYALKPAEGVRISKIVGLQNNLELALAASPIRIEAPIPGRALVGIEVPNTAKATIGLASLLESPEYTDSTKPLLVALGRDITGNAQFTNIAKMPHGLIAGTTGSGKSVTIHNLVVSLLFRNSPDQLRFIMVDPKRVELTLYNDIPHLLTPVITDPKRALIALKWAIKEMERRYDVLQSEKIRELGSYHSDIYLPAKTAWEKDGSPEEAKAQLPEPLPYIVVIIDELSDLMQAYPRELEASIVRLAQMSRAVGIHLILATQRPEVKVITGLIKANIPTRIALKVASQIDSRTIIDGVGAEKLLGQGDMLFKSGDVDKPVRLQSAYITDAELKKVIEYLKNQEATELDSISFDTDTAAGDGAFGTSLGGDDDDDLYEDAKHAVLEAGKASTSYLQRKLRVGYSRAARLIDLLEERGVIGPQDGSKSREVFRQATDEGADEPTS